MTEVVVFVKRVKRDQSRSSIPSGTHWHTFQTHSLKKTLTLQQTHTAHT